MKRLHFSPILLLILPIIALAYLFITGEKKTVNNSNDKVIVSPAINQDQQALALVSNLSEVKAFKTRVNSIGKTKPAIAIDSYPSQEHNYYLVQVFEDVSDGSSGHTATFNWYRVNPKTWEITKQDLSQIDKWDSVSK